MSKLHRPLFLCFALSVGVAGGCRPSPGEGPAGSAPAAPADSAAEAAIAPAPSIPTTIERQTPKAPPLPASATLEQAYDRLASGADHKPYLRALRDQFPQVEVTPPEATAKWTTVSLNQEGARIDAIRFASSLNETADMRWCFIYPRERIKEWFIAPMKGEIPGFETYWGEAAIDTENLDEPADNYTMYQPLGGGQILPGEEYLLWFTFPDAQPVEMRVAIKLLPVSQTSQFISGPEAIARALGLRTPLRRHTPDTPDAFLQRAVQVSNVDVHTAAELAESGLELAPDHSELLRVASILNRRYAQEVARVDREAAASIYEKAAEQARTLAGHEVLTFKERLAVVHALLDAARVQAQRRDGDATISLVREAFEAGFTETSQLQATEDFAFLRDNGEYTALLERWRRLMAPPREIDYEQQPHPADAVEFNGRWFKLHQGMLPWHLAQLRCKERGGHLACIETEAEAEFLRQTWPQGGFWLGGVMEAGRWRWINGQPLTDAPWAEDEPAALGDKARVMVGLNGAWSAVSTVDERIVGYLCEWGQ